MALRRGLCRASTAESKRMGRQAHRRLGRVGRRCRVGRLTQRRNLPGVIGLVMRFELVGFLAVGLLRCSREPRASRRCPACGRSHVSSLAASRGQTGRDSDHPPSACLPDFGCFAALPGRAPRRNRPAARGCARPCLRRRSSASAPAARPASLHSSFRHVSKQFVYGGELRPCRATVAVGLFDRRVHALARTAVAARRQVGARSSRPAAARVSAGRRHRRAPPATAARGRRCEPPAGSVRASAGFSPAGGTVISVAMALAASRSWRSLSDSRLRSIFESLASTSSTVPDVTDRQAGIEFGAWIVLHAFRAGVAAKAARSISPSIAARRAMRR